jgi:arylsulfatase A-like enzyme
VYLVALDSTHFEYAWGDEFKPPFLPYADKIPVTHDYARDANARQLVVNRYKNSVAWIDHLLGRLLLALRATARLDTSLVVITGDHGEAFWEHGTGTHGTNLGGEQLDVGFAMRLPNRPAQRFDRIFSLIDVMPTLLRELELDPSGLDGVPLSDSTGDSAALSFQGWNEQAYAFALTLPTRRLLFELDRQAPLEAEHLLLKDVTDLHDVSLVGREGGSVDDSYDNVLRNLPDVLGRLRFLEL